MKIAAATLMVFALTTCCIAADSPTPTPAPVSFESLLSSLPMQNEREVWKSLSAERRDSPSESKLLQKMRDFPANCQQLQSLLAIGKPLSDYPGLLALGFVGWDSYQKTYVLTVVVPGGRVGWGDYTGFRCNFDRAFNITVIYTFKSPGF